MQIKKMIMYMEAGTGKSSPCFFRAFRLETVRLRQLVVDHKFIIFISGYSAVHDEVDLLGMDMMLHQYHYNNLSQVHNEDKQYCDHDVIVQKLTDRVHR